MRRIMPIAMKLKIAAAGVACLAGPAAIAILVGGSEAPAASVKIEAPALVELAPGTVSYWAPGEFTRDGKPVAAPSRVVTFKRPLAIMKNQVTAADYQRCVDEHACVASAGAPAGPNMPATMVSWRDAQAYASWLSHKLGGRYRLPTDEEWTYAAGSRAPDEAPLVIDANEPANAWISRYEREADLEPAEKEPQPIGSFGANEHGLLDVAGNVWEWTATCYTRVVLDKSGAPTGARMENCGVRVVEGRHRTYISDFIRDARGGGCAFGTPPSNLGFRLVRENENKWWLF
jgi:formylglycine-generating enzyme required for sulfatase activity